MVAMLDLTMMLACSLPALVGGLQYFHEGKTLHLNQTSVGVHLRINTLVTKRDEDAELQSFLLTDSFPRKLQGSNSKFGQNKEEAEGGFGILASKKIKVKMTEHITELIETQLEPPDMWKSSFNSGEKMTGKYDPQDIIDNVGQDWFHGGGENDNIVYHLLKDLSGNLIKKLKACNVGTVDSLSVKNGVQDKWPEVLLVVNGEAYRAKDWLPVLPNKSIMLGAGYDDGQLDASDNGRAVRNLWVPYASLVFVEKTDHNPIELMDRTRAIKNLDSKTNDLVYLQKICVDHRERFWDAMCKSMMKKGKTCWHAGACNGKANLGEHYRAKSSRGGQWIPGAVDTYVPFKFSVSMEKEINNFGYLSEKMVLPMLAGTIPIYSGAKQVSDVFDQKAFVNVNLQAQDKSINFIEKMLGDSSQYKAMVSHPAVQEEAFRKYFTWHSSTFAKYGDHLRQRIIENILEVC